ncbi:Endocuticle structural glycoprotein SgAbd-2, putative [Pediculus humanus corporis]|uniref:Endocuticle structural glycoprotein SgAbd-2, putative n=1 Tax=Pediculus humanus subsp. corporis TaxID=121224 RepID=E0W378_PEDHC|nr:Endocuticle structural glycoprotein SgAbd-2, putative [Pediculus humanus corporis]EEB20084.1 Endocuticle structural glycoprotein SgAbd-2, putative [Pediculus humanus corporis]
MTPILLVVAFAALSAAAPQLQPTQPPVPILRAETNHNLDGSYNFQYETANQISASEQGAVKNPGTDAESLAVQGTFSYVDLDGNQITVNYVADENGFRADGAHLPQAPPIPPEIQEALAQNAAEEARLTPQELEALNSGRYVGN